MAAGIKKVRVIESDGTELIAVKRTDISIDSKEGRELALADNLTTQVNLAWDNVELTSVAAEQGIDLPDWGLDPKELGIEDPTEEANEENEPKERQRDPESEIIVATVSLFGTTEDMMLTEQLTTEQADKLIQLAKTEGAANLMKRIIDAL